MVRFPAASQTNLIRLHFSIHYPTKKYALDYRVRRLIDVSFAYMRLRAGFLTRRHATCWPRSLNGVTYMGRDGLIAAKPTRAVIASAAPELIAGCVSAASDHQPSSIANLARSCSGTSSRDGAK